MPAATPPTVRRLQAKRDRLVQEIRDLSHEIRDVERATGKRISRSSGRIPASMRIRTPNARRLNDVTVSEAILELLRERRKPMHYKDIADTLTSEGRYRTKSRNFLSTVAITILRDQRLKRVEPGVYALKRR